MKCVRKVKAVASFLCTAVLSVAVQSAAADDALVITEPTVIASDVVANEQVSVQSGTAAFGLSGKIICQMLRFNVSENCTTSPWPHSSEGEATRWQLTELMLTDNGVNVAWPAGCTASCTEGEAAHVIDGIISYDSKILSSCNKPLYIDFNGTLTFDSYSIVLGGDVPQRDPYYWTLEAGIVDGGTTNWYVISDIRATNHGHDKWDWTSRYNIRMKTFTPNDCTWRQHPTGVLLPENFSVSVAEGAKATFDSLGSDIGDEFRTITGSGIVEITGTTQASVTRSSDFTGEFNLLGRMKDHIDGSPAGLNVLAGNVTINTQYSDNSGDTFVSEGAMLSADVMKAKYLRFSVQKTTYNSTISTDIYPQLDELELRLGGEVLPWPEGTTAKQLNATDHTQANQLIDGIHDVNHKCFWNSNPITIELPEVTVFDGYGLWTGNDWLCGGPDNTANMFRHPVSWTLEWSMDGANWYVFDKVEDNWTVKHKSLGTEYTIQESDKVPNWGYFYADTLFYVCEGANKFLNTLSPNSTLVVNGTAKIETLEEEVAGLSGSGTLQLADQTFFRVNGKNSEADFAGTISGGTIVKVGEGTQTISGFVSCSEIIVEGGELKFDKAEFDGLEKITLKSGTISGKAVCKYELPIVVEDGENNLRISDGKSGMVIIIK